MIGTSAHGCRSLPSVLELMQAGVELAQRECSMATVTVEVSDEPSKSVAQADDRLPELLAQSLKEPTLPAPIYRYVPDFLASRPTLEQVATFGPTPEIAELDEYERFEHLMVLVQSGNLQHLT